MKKKVSFALLALTLIVAPAVLLAAPVAATMPVIEVDVDIKPGSCPNVVNPRSNGVLPVAILGTVNVDVADINPETIRLGRDGYAESIAALKWHVEDVGTPNPAGDCQCWTVPGDRRPDLIVHFSARDAVEKLGLSSEEGNTVSLVIRAELKNGTELSGTDCVRVKTK